jgi:tellurite resistance-related uncharacterized protein
MNRLLFFTAFSLFVAQSAQAYIPRAKTIVKKMTSNNGQRDYKIVREVDLSSPEKKIKAREVWTVAHGDKMKLEVSSLDSNNPWNFEILYSARNRKTLSRKKAIKSFQKSKDFFEPLFHDRYHKSLLNRLIGYKFVPAWVKDSTPPNYVEGKTKLTPEPFISLAPMEGSVNYAIGAKTNSQGSQNQTVLWVEQDSFIIKKGRLQSEAEFVNSQYQTFVGGLRLPGEQQISWDDKVARIKLLAAERVNATKKDWQLDASEKGTIPTDPLIKEFYSRFR